MPSDNNALVNIQLISERYLSELNSYIATSITISQLFRNLFFYRDNPKMEYLTAKPKLKLGHALRAEHPPPTHHPPTISNAITATL